MLNGCLFLMTWNGDYDFIVYIAGKYLASGTFNLF